MNKLKILLLKKLLINFIASYDLPKGQELQLQETIKLINRYL